MTPPPEMGAHDAPSVVAFDPAAELRIDGVPQHVESMLVREADGAWMLTCEDADGAWIVRLKLRGDFLEESMRSYAAARAREVAA